MTSIVKTVYLNEMAHENLNRLKNDNPSFNLSAFISDSLNNIMRIKGTLESIEIEINKNSLEINKLEERNKFLLIQKQKIVDEENSEREAKENEEKEKERKKNEKLKSYTSLLHYYFNISEEKASELAEEFYGFFVRDEDKVTVFDFGKKINLELRPIEDLK